MTLRSIGLFIAAAVFEIGGALFTAWLQRADITGALHVDWPYDFPQRRPLQDEQRLAVLRRLLHDHELGLRERFAGSVLLLYAQPLTRIAQLCTSDITMTDRGATAIPFARGANVLPAPLASIALALRCQRVADGEQDGWLLPGRKPGTHITVEHLRKRLAVHGITSRPGRHRRRPTPRTDPRRTTRHPPSPRSAMGARRRRHLQRLRRATRVTSATFRKRIPYIHGL